MVRVIIIFLLGCLCLATGMLHKSEEHSRRREHHLENVKVFEKTFKKEFAVFIETGVLSKALNQTFNALNLGRSFTYTENENTPPELAFMSCAVCRLTVATYISQRRIFGASAESLINSAIVLCIELTSFSENLCRPIVTQNLVNSKIFTF